MKINESTYVLSDKGNAGTIALVIGLVGLAASGWGFTADRAQLLHSWLTSFLFWTGVGLGGLFFTLLHHLAGAKWSVTVRRISEATALTLPLMAVLFAPLAFGIHELYHWSHADAVAADELLQKKAAYLNEPFFLIRTAAYFIIWSILAIALRKASTRQDVQPSDTLIARMRKISAAGMILFAVTITFSSFDWLMSLDAHWYSTIFGVYIYSGDFLAFLSFAVLVIGYLWRRKILTKEINVNHLQDIGKYTLAFIIFWAYMAFSQYFLIWYANVPEETVWFLERWEGSWRTVSLIIIFGHFAIPFVVMIFRASKRSIVVMTVMALWMLVMRFIDLYWLVLPGFSHHGAHFTVWDITTLAGIGGLFVWYFLRQLAAQPLVPVGDPSLQESMRFHS
ncbi:MAG: hypothetical protein ACE5FH_04550 [Candidatus Zixiibacteriota bacterium]